MRCGRQASYMDPGKLRGEMAPSPIAALSGLWTAHTPEAGRVRRMLLLFIAIGLMSATDLALTLTYMNGPGMLEANPIARLLVNQGETAPLAMYKALTVIIACLSMFAVRRHRRAELCAWGCTAVLIMLTFHWVRYNAFVDTLGADVTAVTCQVDQPSWLHIDN